MIWTGAHILVLGVCIGAGIVLGIELEAWLRTRTKMRDGTYGLLRQTPCPRCGSTYLGVEDRPPS